MATQRSWQITVTATGTAVQGPNSGPGIFVIKANPANTGTYCYIGNDGAGDVASTTGYTLTKAGGEQAVIAIANLNLLWYDADTNGDKIDVLRYQELRNVAA